MPMQFETSISLLRDFCRVFEIDPDREPVKKITIEVPADGIAWVRVDRLMQVGEKMPLVDLLKSLSVPATDRPIVATEET